MVPINGTYNPNAMAKKSVAVVSAVVDSSCRLQTSADNVGQGQDCATCLAKVVDGTVFPNANSFSGKAIILKADDIYCAHEFIDLTKVIQDNSGESMVLVMRQYHDDIIVDPSKRKWNYNTNL